jgi:GT2 family glycosyltransferase
VDQGQYDEAQEVFALCGCAVAFRTEAGREVDWFDDDFFLYYEDTDLSWRLRAAGWQIRYEPKAVVRHIHSATSVEWSPTFVFYSTRNRLLMLTKDASAARVRREWLAFLRETVNLLRYVIGAARRGRRPPLRRLRMQLRVLASLLRLTPSALRARRRIARSARVPRPELETWLAAPR